MPYIFIRSACELLQSLLLAGSFYGMARYLPANDSVDLLKHRDAHILLLNFDKYYVAVPKWNVLINIYAPCKDIASQGWFFIRVNFLAEKTPVVCKEFLRSPDFLG